jgi:hypothetical protein
MSNVKKEMRNENCSEKPKAAASFVCGGLYLMAGEEGFEPSHAGIKIRCLNQLGDSPTQPFLACFLATYI